MENARGTPWQPDRLDDLLEQPFDELRQKQRTIIINRLDALYAQLTQLEEELDELIDQPAVVPN